MKLKVKLEKGPQQLCTGNRLQSLLNSAKCSQDLTITTH